MTRRGLDDSARMTRWGTITTRGWLGETRLTRRGRLNEAMTRRGWLGEVDSTRTTQRDDDSTRMTRRGKMCRQRLLDESGLLTTERDICFANIVLETIFIFSHYFKCSIFLEIMVIYPIFIRLFYFTHQSIVLNTKVSFHFHLYNYYMYKLVSLLDA